MTPPVKISRVLQIAIGVLLALLTEVRAWAAGDGLMQATPTFYLDLTFGFTTYKSELVQSNDTGTGLTYSLGGYAGQDHQVGFKTEVDSTTTTFALNDSSTTVVWQDSIINYRLSYFYLGVVFSQLDIKLNNAGTDEVDAGATGMGYNAGLLIPIQRVGFFYTDVIGVTPTTSRNALTGDYTAGARMDIDIGTSFDLTRNAVDMMVGYKQRTMAMSSTLSGTETYYCTYIGFRFGAFF